MQSTTRRKHVIRVAIFALLCTASSCVHTKSEIPFREQKHRDPYWALIYVYREPGGAQGDISWGVFLDENVVGRLRQGAYLTMHAAPGSHTVYVGGNASRSTSFTNAGLLPALVEYSINRRIKPLEIKVKSGETYYLRCSGVERQFLPRAQAIETLRTMHYDQGT